MQTGNTDFIYKNELDKVCFQHDMVYGKSKDLLKRTHSNNVLKDNAFTMQVIQNITVIKEDWHQWFTNFLTKCLVEVVLLMNQIISWQMNVIDQLLQN